MEAEELAKKRKYNVEWAARLGQDINNRDAALPTLSVTVENHFLEKYRILDESEAIYTGSESLSWLNLAQTYIGRDWQNAAEDEPEEDEEDSKKKKKVRRVKVNKSIPNPSKSKFLGEYLGFEQWLAFRDKARKDLFWLGRNVLKHDFVAHVHQPIADQFVQKNFDGVYHRGYTIGEVHTAIGKQIRTDENGQSTKELLLLDSRGFFKSTMNRVDCAQWMLNVPDIRILLMTAEKKLASAFMKAIKGYFHLPEGGDPSDFHILFPEYILRKRPGISNTPILLRCRRHTQVEPSLWVNSIESGLSGWHCDVKKSDDVVNDKNCNNPTTRESLKDQIDNSANLKDGWGFADNIGTRYFPDDWYGTRLDIRDKKPLKYFKRACWKVKPEYLNIPLKELTEEMVDLTFPELSTNAFQELRGKLLDNETIFRCQQLNEPAMEDVDTFRVTFTEDALRKHLYPMASAPTQGDIFVAWDWAFSHQKYSDFSVGVAARRYLKDGRWGLAILDVRFGRWTASELAQQIVKMDKDWNPCQTQIEKTVNAELLQLELQRWYVRQGVIPRIWWRQPSLEKDAKRNRIKQLEILLANDLLWFVFGPWNDEAFSQMTKYTGEFKNRGRKDDIPDAMSMLYFFLPTSAISTVDTEAQDKVKDEMRIAQARAEFHRRIFGGWGDTKPSQPSSEPAPPSNDPRNKIFGRNGLHI